MEDPRSRRLAWLWVGLCTATIYGIIPLARAIQRFVSTHGGRVLFGYLVVGTTAAAFCGLVYVLYFRFRIHRAARYLWLILVAFCYLYFTLMLWKTPEAAVHFLQYGLLGYFLFRALSLSIKDKSIYPAALLIGSLIGTFDEIIQWAVPGRYWDLQDVGLNAIAVGLFQIALWQGVRPKIISEKVRPQSIGRISILLGANLVLLGLCLSNTPGVVTWMAGRLPALAFLKKEEAMSEYRYKHKDQEIGVFYSRLNLGDLREVDQERADEYGRLLWEWKDKGYDDFLRTFTSSTHPFIYEFRIHVFRRDRKSADAERTQNEDEKKKLLFIACKENQILEKYFGRTFQKSPYRWPQEKTTGVATKVDCVPFYRSPVSAGLFATLKGKTLWTAIGALLALLMIFNRFVVRRS